MTPEIDRVRLMACLNCDAAFEINPPWTSFQIPITQQCPTCLHINPMPSGGFEFNRGNQPKERLPRDLKFRAMNPYVHQDNEILSKIKTLELLLPVGAFLTNLRRLKRLHAMPAEVHILTTVWCNANDIAKDMPEPDAGSGNETLSAPREFFSAITLIAGAKGIDEARINGADESFETMVADSHHRLWHGLESILTSQITGMWTAFEVLAADLWEVALNVHPHSLSDLDKGKPQKRGSIHSDRSAKQSGNSSDNEKMMRWSRFQEFGFDLSSKMGTLLKSRFDFSDIDDAREAYWSSFESKEIRDCIDSECLRKLAKTRNLIVHRSGVIDKKFKSFMESVDADWKLQEGSRLPVDGELVNEMIRPVLDACFQLIRFVDQWIIDNPQPKKEIE